VVGNVGVGFVLFGSYGGLTGGDGLTCTGDSGGPALIVEEGEERVLAVHSMAICGKYSQCTRVAPYVDWLAKQSGGNLGVTVDVTPPEIALEAPGPDATRSADDVAPAPGCIVAPAAPAGDDALGLVLVLVFVFGLVLVRSRPPRRAQRSRARKPSYGSMRSDR